MQPQISALCRCSCKVLAVLFTTAILGVPGATVAADGPAITGPVTSGSKPNAFEANLEDLKPSGYMEQEFFVEGTAEGKLKPEDPESARPYKIRILVRRPVDSKKFNGTVVVEWLNMAGNTSAPGWFIMRDLLVRDGYAWVGVSAQPTGINFVRTWDPQRYGSLAHPGTPPPPTEGAAPVRANQSQETYSDAIFSQAAIALRHPSGVDPMGGLKVQRILGYAFSSAAIRMSSYVNTAQRRDHAYDGFLFEAMMMPIEMVNLGVPIFVVNSEHEVSLYLTNRQADSSSYREWEVAGTGHLPRRYIDEQTQSSTRDGVEFRIGQGCDLPAGDIAIEYVMRAALYDLNNWVKAGKEPPHAPVITLDPGTPPTIARDKFGNALGGIRLPFIEAPTGKYVAIGTPAACALVPGVVAFDKGTLTSLYPNHKSYVAAVNRAANRAVKDEFLLPADAKTVREEAATSSIGEKSSGN